MIKKDRLNKIILIYIFTSLLSRAENNLALEGGVANADGVISIGRNAGGYDDGKDIINPPNKTPKVSTQGENSIYLGIGAGSNGNHNLFGSTRGSIFLGQDAGSYIEGDANIAGGSTGGLNHTGSQNIFFGDNARNMTGAIDNKVQATYGNRNIMFGANYINSSVYNKEKKQKNYINDTIRVGTLAKAMKSNNIAIGSAFEIGGVGAVSEGETSIAIGVGTLTKAKNSIAFGSNAKVENEEHENSVAFGNLSVTKDNNKKVKKSNIGDIVYTFAGDSIGVVSIGNDEEQRQIVNVAPGEISATSTNIVNGSQLYSLAVEIEKHLIKQKPFTYVLADGDNDIELVKISGLYYVKSELNGLKYDISLKKFVDDDGVVSNTQPVTLTKDQLKNLRIKATTTDPKVIFNISSGLADVNSELKDKLKGYTFDENDAIDMISNNKSIFSDDINKLNTVATIGDLKTLAILGISFSGNIGNTHRTLGKNIGLFGKTGADFNLYDTYNIATNVNGDKFEIGMRKAPKFDEVSVGTDENSLITISNEGINAQEKPITNVANIDIEKEPTSLVNGAVAYNELSKKIDLDFGNIDNDGKDKITSLVDVEVENGLELVKSVNDETREKTFKVGLTKDLKDKIDSLGKGVIEEGNNATITGDTLNEKLNNLDISYKADSDTSSKTVKLNKGFNFVGDENENIKIEAKENGAVEYTLNKNLKAIDSITVGDVVIDSEKIDLAGNKITNVLNDEETVKNGSTDLVNGGTLHTELNKNTSKDLDINGDGENVIKGLIEVEGDNNIKVETSNVNGVKTFNLKLELDQETLNNINKEETVVSADENYIVVNNTAKNKTGGTEFQVDLNSDIKEKLDKVGTGEVEKGNTNTVTGQKVKTAIDNLTIKYKANSDDSTEKEVTIKKGLDFTSKNINIETEENGKVKYSVSKKLEDVDSITGLDDLNENSSGDSLANKNYVDKTINTTEYKLNVDVAGAYAVSGIPQVTYNKLVAVGVGVGVYKDSTALAIGVSGQNKDRNFVYKLSVSLGNAKNVGFNAGFNYSLSKQRKVENATISDLKTEINKLSRKIKESSLTNSRNYLIDNFGLNSSYITISQTEKLKEIVSLVNKMDTKTTIEIIGYADIRHNEKYNLDLGMKRAKAAKYALIKLGIKDSVEIIVKSRGYNEKVEGDYAKQRRVEILINNFDEYVK